MKILFKLAITITLSLSVVINANAFDIYGFKDIKFGTHLRKLQISTLGPGNLGDGNIAKNTRLQGIKISQRTFMGHPIHRLIVDTDRASRVKRIILRPNELSTDDVINTLTRKLGPAMLREEKFPLSSTGFTRNIWIANNGASISVIKLEPVMICKGMFDCEDNSEEEPIVIYSSIEETEKIIKAIKPNKPKKPILLNDF